MSLSEPQSYRFSEAPIWDLQRAYYEEQGITAWQRDEVPSYITSNPMLAGSYAEVIFGFLQDRARLDETSEPVTIVELGAGSGRLAFHVLKELRQLSALAGFPLPPYRYVMSDLAEGNIAYWQQHPSLMSYVEQGNLDFAKFDAAVDTELHLVVSGECLARGSLRQPLLIIANYFFDSIPQELIYIENNQVYECWINCYIPKLDKDWTASEQLKNLVAEYEYRKSAEFEAGSYAYQSLIELYARELDDSHVLFPIVGLDCLDRLSQLSTEGFLLLTADKGEHQLASWAYNEPPELIHHGSFSLTANYHAITAYYEEKGAESLFTAHPHHHLNVGCVLHLADLPSYGLTRLAYRRYIERFGPDDFITIKEWLDDHLAHLDIPQMLAYWRLSGFDSQFFLQNASRLMDLIVTSEEADCAGISQGIAEMWSGYYAMEISNKVALACASLYYRMEMFSEALPFYLAAEDMQDASIVYEMAICCYEIGDMAGTKAYIEQTLILSPHHEEALSLLGLLE
ncbi:SAM-dependent methyltransferase [Paenibacillus sp. HWE-109]|uniref:SAM-dependent methyltransferase n=1 Tax=Paenibacillus sp. HWE-109 TaxID=1306526 RepID=UPI001EDC9ADE|nr:SAM-dependent methyltransferase [Paenibacillus sp. HWE-109]UKS29179.1 SAM-dependent methyltransferase [Paenibacillus sp. HWE-109]